MQNHELKNAEPKNAEPYIWLDESAFETRPSLLAVIMDGVRDESAFSEQTLLTSNGSEHAFAYMCTRNRHFPI